MWATPQLKLTTQPSVVLVIGVNGVGKTTTIGKLAHQLQRRGEEGAAVRGGYVPCGGGGSAGDLGRTRPGRISSGSMREPTLRRRGVRRHFRPPRPGHSDVILCDTAGRLHNKQNLMNELGKISRIIDRELPDADKEVLLVLDAHHRPERPDCRPSSSRRSPGSPAWP